MLKDHKQAQKVRRYSLPMYACSHPRQDREKKVSKLEQSGLTEEELLAKQQALFAESRARYESGQQ